MAFLIISLVLHAICSNAVTIDPTSNDEYISVKLTDDPRGINGINSNNEWNISDSGINPLYDWALRLDLDAEEYSFRSGVDGSSISITANLYRGTAQCDAHFAFSIGYNKYFTFMVDLDGGYDINVEMEEERKGIFIYPECGSTAIASGNVATLMSAIPSSDYDYVTVREELCGGYQDNCYRLTETQNGANYPFTFELINNDLSDTFTFKFSSPTFSGNNALECTYDTSLPTEKDIKMYIVPDPGTSTGETVIISSFEVNETLTGFPETDSPTTAAPTPQPILDSCDFDIDAYFEQCYCSDDDANGQIGSPFLHRNNPEKNIYYNEYYSGNYDDNGGDILKYLHFLVDLIILAILVSKSLKCFVNRNIKEDWL